MIKYNLITSVIGFKKGKLLQLQLALYHDIFDTAIIKEIN